MTRPTECLVSNRSNWLCETNATLPSGNSAVRIARLGTGYLYDPEVRYTVASAAVRMRLDPAVVDPNQSVKIRQKFRLPYALQPSPVP